MKHNSVPFLMKSLAIIISVSLFTISLNCQEIFKQVDSIVNLIESSKNLDSQIRSDTTWASHTEYWVINSDEFYSRNNNPLKIVCQATRYPWSTGFSSGILLNHYTFYFNNDTLIKILIKDYQYPPTSYEQYYFKGNDLADMKSKGLEFTDKYKRIELYYGLAYELLNDFKQGKIK